MRIWCARTVGRGAIEKGPDPNPPRVKTTWVVELLRESIEWQALLESGKVANQ